MVSNINRIDSLLNEHRDLLDLLNAKDDATVIRALLFAVALRLATLSTSLESKEFAKLLRRAGLGEEMVTALIVFEANGEVLH